MRRGKSPEQKARENGYTHYCGISDYDRSTFKDRVEKEKQEHPDRKYIQVKEGYRTTLYWKYRELKSAQIEETKEAFITTSAELVIHKEDFAKIEAEIKRLESLRFETQRTIQQKQELVSKYEEQLKVSVVVAQP
jgi:ferredoxin-NADP reductase